MSGQGAATTHGSLLATAEIPSHPLHGRAERYQGSFKDDRRHGRGTCIYPDGGRYIGEWSNGAMDGEGRFEYSNGDVFVGTFASQRRVRGKLTWAATGDEYDGEFGGKADVPNGQGTRHYVAADVVHVGRWANGEPEGEGERRDRRSGAVYRGHFVGATLSGEGEEVLMAGQAPSSAATATGATAVTTAVRAVAERYAGHFERGVRHGRGRAEHGAGRSWSGEWVSAWQGEWVNGEPSGECEAFIEKSAMGESTYSGGWSHGARHGHGKQLDADGRSYEGDYHRGLPEGEGKERLAAGSPSAARGGGGTDAGGADAGGGEVYVGGFLAGRRHGFGELTRERGWAFHGQFEAGGQRGEGVLYLGSLTGAPAPGAADGAAGPADSEGGGGGHVRGASFIDFELRGAGVRRYANGDEYEGDMDGVMPSGRGQMRYADGRVLEAHFVSDLGWPPDGL